MNTASDSMENVGKEKEKTRMRDQFIPVRTRSGF